MGREEERICKPGSAADLPFGHLASFCPWQWMLTNFFANSGNSDLHSPYFNQQLMQVRIVIIFLGKSLQLNSFENTL